jgi:hypothetical protein
MVPPEVPRCQVAALLVVVVATSAGVLAYSAGNPSSPHCMTDSGGTACPPANGNITFASEDVVVPFNSSGPIVATNVSFQGVTFHLWPYQLPPPIEFLEGIAMEPVGVNLTFVVPPHGSWFSPDGLFGVGWISGTNGTIGAEVSVANPLPGYAAQNVTTTWESAGSSPSEIVDVQGVLFSWHTWTDFPRVSVNATATLANGTRVVMALFQGADEYIACTGPSVGAIHTLLANSSCLEDGDPALGVAMAWTIDVSAHTDLNLVTLMVRVG